MHHLSKIPGLGRSSRGENGDSFQYSCLKKSHEQRTLAGYSPKDHKESDMTGHTHIRLLKVNYYMDLGRTMV